MNCKLCNVDAPLIDAHIIPKPFFVCDGMKGSPPHRLLSNSKGEYPQKLPIGFYDSGILCGPCDRRLGVWDQYGVELFLQQLNMFIPLEDRSEVNAFGKSDFDFTRLRLFLLSVLWRAHHSTHPVFRRVNLGPYADRLHTMITAADPGRADEFDVVLSAFTVNGRIPDSRVPIMDPFRERWNGANAYRFSFGIITAYIKVDKLRFPPSLSRIAVAPNRPLLLIERDFLSSSEADAARAVIRAPQNHNVFKEHRPSRDGV